MGTLAVGHEELKEKWQSKTTPERPRVKKDEVTRRWGESPVFPHCSNPTPGNCLIHNRSSRDVLEGRERGMEGRRMGLQNRPFSST